MKRAINNALLGGQSDMFAPRCEFHTVKSPIWENDTWEVSLSDVSTVTLHRRTNDQKLLRIIHRNKTFSRRSDPKIRMRIIHECVLYAEKYGINVLEKYWDQSDFMRKLRSVHLWRVFSQGSDISNFYNTCSSSKRIFIKDRFRSFVPIFPI